MTWERKRRSVAGLVVAAVLLLVTASPLSAHGGLKSSVPAAGSHVVSVLRELRLTFSDASPLNVTRVRLVGADSQAVAMGAMSHLDGDARREVLVPILGALVAGTYAVEWQTAGADGHPVRGRFTFMMMVATPPPENAAPVAPTLQPQDSSVTFDASSPMYVAIRWTTFLAILSLVGVAVFRFVVLRASVGLSEAVRAGSAARALTVASWFAIVLGLVAVARLGAQSYAFFGTDAFDVRRTFGLLQGTAWGAGWILQAAAALLVWLSARLVRAGRVTAWWGIALGALLAAATPALSGHAAATGTLAVTGDVVHVLAAGGWIGSLFLVFIAGLPAARFAPEGDRERAVAMLVNAFSPVALVSAALLGGSGLLSAWLSFTGLSDAWLTLYGRTLALKLIVLSAVIATGWYNWKRVTPRLNTAEGTPLLRKTIAAELTVAVLVLGVTAVLTATPTPKDVAEMSGHDMRTRSP